MNELRSRHLVERAALRLRGELGLDGSAGAVPAFTPEPEAAREAGAALGPEPLNASVSAGPDAPAPPASIAARGPNMPLPGGLLGDLAEPAPPRPSGTPEPVSMAVLQGAGLALTGGRRTRIAEEFSVSAGALLRGLRAGQREAQVAGPAVSQVPAFANLLLVTSAKPGEGKTFSALNLAATLAHNGLARIVLADIDSKPASLTALLGMNGRPGLFDLAADPALKPDSVLVGTAIRDLSFLPLGTRDGAGGSQGLTRRLGTAIERIARRLSGQVVILDAPPCLATSEPAALAPMVGMVAMVVEAERTQREEIETALELVATCSNVMLLLNKIRGSRGHAFGDYDYYGA